MCQVIVYVSNLAVLFSITTLKSSLDAKQNHPTVTRRASKLKTEKLKTWNKINVGSLPCVHSSETIIAYQITHDAQLPKAEERAVRFVFLIVLRELNTNWISTGLLSGATKTDYNMCYLYLYGAGRGLMGREGGISKTYK